MNQIATRKPSGLMPSIAPIKTSFEFMAAYSATVKPHADVGAPQHYTAAVQAEARKILELLRPFGRPVADQTLRVWLAPIAGSVRNPKTADEIEMWLPGMMIAVGHLEAGAFNETTQRELLQSCPFFPAPADVYAIVSKPAVAIRQRIFYLEQIANGATAPGRGSAV